LPERGSFKVEDISAGILRKTASSLRTFNTTAPSVYRKDDHQEQRGGKRREGFQFCKITPKGFAGCVHGYFVPVTQFQKDVCHEHAVFGVILYHRKIVLFAPHCTAAKRINPLFL
jgi:hypothetical protein